MEQMKTLEQQNDAHKASARSFSEGWEEAWKHLEERVRQRPGLYVLIAIALGYVLQAIPLRSVLVLAVKLCLRLALPILFLFCAFQVTKEHQ
jgi:hypothetical protein